MVAVPVWATIFNKITSGHKDGRMGGKLIWNIYVWYLLFTQVWDQWCILSAHKNVYLIPSVSKIQWRVSSNLCSVVLCCWKHNFCTENKVWGCLFRSKPKRKSALWLDRMWNSVLLAAFPVGKCDNLTGSYVEKWNFPKWDQWSISSFLSVHYIIFSVCQGDHKLSSRIQFKWVKWR